MSDPNPTMTKWKRLFNAFVERQNHSQNRRAVLEFIRRAMKPERYAKEPDFAEWGDRLEIFGLDLRHTPSVEAFCDHLARSRSRLDFIVKSAHVYETEFEYMNTVLARVDSSG